MIEDIHSAAIAGATSNQLKELGSFERSVKRVMKQLAEAQANRSGTCGSDKANAYETGRVEHEWQEAEKGEISVGNNMMTRARQASGGQHGNSGATAIGISGSVL